jgi:xanthine dehydrogenase accessory factor
MGEMVAPFPAEVLAETERSLQRWGRVVLCQIVRADGSTPGKVGWKLLVRPDGSACGNLGGGAFEAMVQADAAAKLVNGAGASEVKRYYLTEEATRGEATGMVCGGMAEVFLEVVESPPVLAICGGGPVGQALARAGALAGFDLLVVEDREEFRNPELFPERTRFGAVERDFGDEFLGGVAGRELYVAVVSRCWETDVAAMAGVVRQAPRGLRYLGLMGSRRKVERVREELAAQGADLDSLPLRAPIGLPIGGDSPGEIAISILAEIIGVRYEASPSSH